ncbi:MAG TPA: hypothetical protein DDZ51_16700 [Planctomycetaceae bacterium]|nr:hypothetical protein [Planctomycetaceae bacterium]
MKSSKNTLETAASDSTWNSFWFGHWESETLLATASLAMVRIGLAVVAFWYFASHWSDVAFWFAGDGIVSAQALGVFLTDADLGDAVGWRLSPLYWVDSPMLLRAFLLVGMLLAVAMPLVRSTRAVTTMLWLSVVWLANRSIMIGGLEEVTLAWGLGYLVIAPVRTPISDPPSGTAAWTTTLARRLIQVHLSIVFLVTGLAMLSSLAWWDGTGVMAVVSPVESRYFDFTETLRSPRVHEWLTHGIVLGAIALPPLLWIQSTRTVGFCFAVIWCIGLAILSSQGMHFLALAVLSLSFLPEKFAARLFSRTDP